MSLASSHDLLIPQIEAFAEIDPDDSQAVRAGAIALEGLLLASPATPEDTLAASLRPEVLNSVQALYERYETDLEREFADKILTGEASVEDYPLYERFERLIKAEIELANITLQDRILFIGSGPFPISPILFNKLTGAKVVCHDISTEACETSREVIEKLDLSNDIGVIDVSGPDWEYPERKYGYNVIVVALLARPKAGIAMNVFQFGPRGRRVIFRNSEGNRQILYSGINQEILSGNYETYTVKDEHHAAEDDTISALYTSVSGLREKF